MHFYIGSVIHIERKQRFQLSKLPTAPALFRYDPEPNMEIVLTNFLTEAAGLEDNLIGIN